MKEKTNRKQGKKATILALVIACLLVVGIVGPPVIGSVIWYYATVSKHQEELQSYSPEVYEHLLEATNNIFREDECVIDIEAIPEDIVVENFEMKDNKFVCKLRWDDGKNGKYIPVANMTAEISGDFKILSITSDYSSEEDFVKAFKNNIKTESSGIKITICGIESMIYALGIVIWARYDDIIIKCKKIFHPKK